MLEVACASDLSSLLLTADDASRGRNSPQSCSFVTDHKIFEGPCGESWLVELFVCNPKKARRSSLYQLGTAGAQSELARCCGYQFKLAFRECPVDASVGEYPNACSIAKLHKVFAMFWEPKSMTFLCERCAVLLMHGMFIWARRADVYNAFVRCCGKNSCKRGAAATPIASKDAVCWNLSLPGA